VVAHRLRYVPLRVGSRFRPEIDVAAVAARRSSLLFPLVLSSAIAQLQSNSR
jgi:hypothetical protein